jgi:cysteinyl-tRNA synthetase
MHKSLGNFWPLTAALSRYEPEVVRFFLLNVQYRGPIDFTPDSIDEAKRSYERLQETVRTVDAERRRAPEKGTADAGIRSATKTALTNFDAAMSDDFNTREAIAVLFEYARILNKAIEDGAGRDALGEAAGLFQTVGDVLGLFQVHALGSDLLDGVMDLVVGLREDARKRKDFATADRIRDALTALGIALEDTREGVRWKRK